MPFPLSIDKMNVATTALAHYSVLFFVMIVVRFFFSSFFLSFSARFLPSKLNYGHYYIRLKWMCLENVKPFQFFEYVYRLHWRINVRSQVLSCAPPNCLKNYFTAAIICCSFDILWLLIFSVIWFVVYGRAFNCEKMPSMMVLWEEACSHCFLLLLFFFI